MQFFLPLIKADQEKRLVYARAAVEEPDKAREIMDYATAVPAFKQWSSTFEKATLGKSLGNIRAMHNPKHLAGKVQEIVYNDAEKAVDVCIKVLDPVDWHKVEEGGYTGLSIGGGYLKKWTDAATGCTRYTPRIAEISFVDSPCIPSARILELQKADGSVEEVLLKGIPRTFAELVPPPTFGALLNKGFIPPMAGAVRRTVPELLNDTSHLSRHVRGKTLSMTQPSAKVAEPRRWSFQSRGKTFSGTHEGDAPVPRTMSSGKTFKQADPFADLEKVGAHPGFARAAASIERREGVSADRAGAILAAGARNAGKSAIRRNPRLRRVGGVHARKQELIDNLQKDFLTEPDNSISQWTAGRGDQTYAPNQFTFHQNKNYFPGFPGGAAKQETLAGLVKRLPKSPDSPEARAKIHTVLHEFKHGGLRSYRGVNPRTGKPRQGPKVTDRKQAIAIALNQARRMGKTEPAFVAALAGRLEKRITAPEHQLSRRIREAGKTARLGPAIGGGLGAAAGLSVAGPLGGLAGAALGASVGHRMQATHRAQRQIQAEQWVHGQLSEKERAQRVAAAKSRWAKEGHPNIDDHHQAVLAQAKKAILGRSNKVAAAQALHDNTWHSVADAQGAYDKMRAHTPKRHSIMMEVPHTNGLVYNPEGIGGDHFDRNGIPKKTIYLMHPHEVDDWIAKHGMHSKAVRKDAPYGEVTDIDDLFKPPSTDPERLEKFIIPAALGLGAAYMGAKAGAGIGARSGVRRLSSRLMSGHITDNDFHPKHIIGRTAGGALAGAVGAGAAGIAAGRRLERPKKAA